jgi:hypothetical protein
MAGAQVTRHEGYEDDLFAHSHRRNSDPETSDESAAALSRSEVTECIDAITAEVRRAGPLGLTPGEISERISWTYDQVWRRSSDAVTKGRIHKDGKRRWAVTGRMQEICRFGAGPERVVQTNTCPLCGHTVAVPA